MMGKYEEEMLTGDLYRQVQFAPTGNKQGNTHTAKDFVQKAKVLSSKVPDPEAWLFGSKAKPAPVPEVIIPAVETAEALPRVIAVNFDEQQHELGLRRDDSSELNSSADSMDLRRSFQDVLNQHRSPAPMAVNLKKDCSFESVSVGAEEEEEEDEKVDKEDKGEEVREDRFVRVTSANPFPPPTSTSPILRKSKSSVNKVPVPGPIPVPTSSDEILQHLLLERRRSNSLATENESLRIVIENLKKQDEGDHLLEGGDSQNAAAGQTQTLIMENLRQANSVLQDKVKELAIMNNSFQDRLQEKERQMEQLGRQHAVTTDQLSGLSMQLEKLGEVNREGLLRENVLENLVTNLQVKLGSTKAELETGNEARREAGAKFDVEREEMNDKIQALTVQLGDVTKAKKLETAKLRREKAQLNGASASLESELAELKGRDERLVELESKFRTVTEENRALRETALRGEVEARRAVVEKEAELEALRAEHKSLSKKHQLVENSVKELKKELHRSKVQLDGVQEQSAGVQVNLKRFYEAEIRGLREELESLGVHVGGSGGGGAVRSSFQGELLGGDGFSDSEGSGGEEEDEEDEETNKNDTSGADEGGGEGEGEGKEKKGLFGFFRRESESQKRERRLSNALDMIPG